MTWPGIEPRSPGPLANTLTARPMSGICGSHYSSEMCCNRSNFNQEPKSLSLSIHLSIYVAPTTQLKCVVFDQILTQSQNLSLSLSFSLSLSLSLSFFSLSLSRARYLSIYLSMCLSPVHEMCCNQLNFNPETKFSLSLSLSLSLYLSIYLYLSYHSSEIDNTTKIQTAYCSCCLLTGWASTISPRKELVSFFNFQAELEAEINTRKKKNRKKSFLMILADLTLLWSRFLIYQL